MPAPPRLLDKERHESAAFAHAGKAGGRHSRAATEPQLGQVCGQCERDAERVVGNAPASDSGGGPSLGTASAATSSAATLTCGGDTQARRAVTVASTKGSLI